MKAIVTGATGFVGSHVVDRLLNERADITCLVRSTSNTTRLNAQNVTTAAVALDDIEALKPVLADADVVFHIAGLTRARCEADYLAVNRDQTHALLTATAAAASHLKRFVYVSSLAAVGPNPSNEPQDETTVPHPLPGYGASKLAGENVTRDVAERLPVTIVRPPAVYGPRDTNMVSLFRAGQRLRRAPVVGSPLKQVSMVHATDLANGIWLAGTRPEAVGQTYFIDGGIYSFADIIAALSTALNMTIRPLPIPHWVSWLIGEIGELKWTLTGKPQIVSRRKMKDLRQPRWTCSIAKATRELSYQPSISLATGMKETAESYVTEGLLKPLPTA